jgi:glutamate/tyrosine decarboxylase-like PLP-dependent enzyme
MTISREQLLKSASERAITYLETIQSRRVAPSEDSRKQLAVLHHDLPAMGIAPETVLNTLDSVCSPATMGMAGPRFFGFVIGGALPVAVASNWLATAWDQNTGYFASTPATSTLEVVALRWLLDILGLPETCGAGFVTGATMANFTCLAAARHHVLAKAGWDVNEQGFNGAPAIQIVVGEEIHPTAQKALRLLGFGNKQLIVVPADNRGRMRLDKLPTLKSPCIMISQAGNVNTGACDAIGDISDIAHQTGAWVHVDGAFGLWARAVPEKKHLVEGIDKADSWATDCHKWLNVPYDSGVAFVKHRDALRESMAISAAYLPLDPSIRNPSDFTPELSRRARGVDVWAALLSLGRNGVADMIGGNCKLAVRFAERLKAEGYEILNEVVLNQVLVKFGDAERTTRIIEEIQREGTCWCGITKWQGQTAMRISVSSWATTEQDVEESLVAIIRIARKNV